MRETLPIVSELNRLKGKVLGKNQRFINARS